MQNAENVTITCLKVTQPTRTGEEYDDTLARLGPPSSQNRLHGLARTETSSHSFLSMCVCVCALGYLSIMKCYKPPFCYCNILGHLDQTYW